MERDRGEETVERWGAAVKQAAARLASRAFPALSLAALEIDAARLVARDIPQLFSRDLRQIDPSLNEELLELYGVSEQVLANRFAFFNRCHQFPATIDWRLQESRGWLSELQAFNFALPLAMTCRISGEERYARHLRHLIAHWIAENPPLAGPGWWPAPLARRVRNWILAADLARSDWEGDADFLDVVCRSLALQAALLLRSAGRPRTLDEVRGLLLAGKFFTRSGGPELQAAALAALALELESLSSLKASPSGYVELAATLLEFLLFGAGRVDELKQALRQVLDILEGILLADGSLPLFGAPARDDFADVANLASVRLADPTWKGLGDKFGILPYLLLGEEGKARFEALPEKSWEARSHLLPEHGYGRLCGEDLSALVVCGQSGFSAGANASPVTFELAVQAHRVIVDTAGRSAEDDGRSLSDPRDHNVFLVEGQGNGVALALSRRATALDGDEKLDFERGHGFTGLRWPECRFGRLRHRRAWYCLEGRYWVILEHLEGKGTASGASLLHFYPTFEVELLADRALARSRVLTVTVIPFGPTGAEMTVSRGDAGEFPGWYAPGFGVRYPASVLASRWREVNLPWVGGLIIIPGTEVDFRAGQPDVEPGAISLELAGKRYKLSLSRFAPGPSPTSSMCRRRVELAS